MTTPLPFPSLARGVAASEGKHGSDGMKIDIPHGKGTKGSGGGHESVTSHHSVPHRATHHQHQHQHDKDHHHPTQTPRRGSIPSIGDTGYTAHPRGSSTHHGTWHHRPRPPHSTADSYFPHAVHGASHDASASAPIGLSQQLQPPPRTPGSMRGHSRQTSTQGGPSAGGPVAATTPGTSGRRGSQQMQLSLSTQSRGGNNDLDDERPQGFDAFAHGPPSPSTLTDIILGIHSTLYGGKRTPEEVRELVSRFYDRDAVFESPLLAAVGREQIANQFIMAFSLPGMDVSSELRDVICSDFEFDGTRAGIIDQTLSVTLLPSLFGTSSGGSGSSKDGARSAGFPYSSHTGHDYYDDVHQPHAGTSTPGYTLQSNITPHPFASYSQSHTPAAGSTFSRHGMSQAHSPTTPYSLSSMWGSLGASRPHTPGSQVPPHHVRPFSSSQQPQNQRASTPPSVNGEFDGDSTSEQHGTSMSTIVGTEDGSGAAHHLVPHQPDLRMPDNVVSPHWTSQGLGRMTLHAFLWGILHPRAVLKHICTINLRLMSRLEFNDAGQIVRHEDTWGVREMIEGTVPFASLLYSIERRIVGHICSFAIGRGFRLSSALTRHAIGPSHHPNEDGRDQTSRQRAIEDQLKGEYGIHRPDANEAAHALLLGYNRHNQMMSMARSRASSPTRTRFFGHGPFTTSGMGSAHTSRSRARSVVGGSVSAGPARAASSDNLVGIGNALPSSSSFGERERGSTHGGETLPPDSSARYRTGSRRITTSTASAPPSGAHGAHEGSHDANPSWQSGDFFHASYDGSGSNWEGNKSRAPDRDDH